MAGSETTGAVLVTRPAQQAESLCASLQATGYTVRRQPLLELEGLEALDPADRQRVLDLDLYQHVIFVSANAVRFGMAWIEDYWPQLPVGLNWYAVGEHSAALLASHGLTVLSPERDMSSEGLLRLPSLNGVAGQRVLIVRGQGGRTTLREELSARGARVDDLACYRRSRPPLAAGELAEKLYNWDVRIVLISSGEGLQNLLALLSPGETTKFRGIILIVPSQRVARMARDAGFSRIVTAENATDGAMLGALETCKPSSGD
jgi:uroporphyrinogen-III synthase